MGLNGTLVPPGRYEVATKLFPRVLLLLDIINVDKRADAHVKGGWLRGVVIKMRRGGKKSLIDTAGNEARVEPGGGRFSPRWSATNTPKRLNGVTHAACSFARGTPCKLIDRAKL